MEVNATFYRLPAPGTAEAWAARVPGDFVFAVKVSRYLTHIRRLRDPAEPVGRFMAVAEALGPRLGPVLMQLPPTMRADLDALDATLADVPLRRPGGRRAAPRILVRRGAVRAAGAPRTRMPGRLRPRVGMMTRWTTTARSRASAARRWPGPAPATWRASPRRRPRCAWSPTSWPCCACASAWTASPARPRTRPEVAEALGLGGARLEEMVAALEDDVIAELGGPAA